MKNIVIKKVQSIDSHTYKRLRDLFVELYPNNPPLTFDKFKKVIETGPVEIYVALSGEGKVVATVSIASYEKLGGKVFVIEDVVVEKSSRGKGIGFKLNKTILDLARSRGADFIDVSTRRAKARKFYLKCGFVDKDKDRPCFSLRYFF